jgi:hypothetical protein
LCGGGYELAKIDPKIAISIPSCKEKIWGRIPIGPNRLGKTAKSIDSMAEISY